MVARTAAMLVVAGVVLSALVSGATGAIVAPIAAGQAVAEGSRGPQGEPGPQGATGATGATGPQGSPGVEDYYAFAVNADGTVQGGTPDFNSTRTGPGQYVFTFGGAFASAYPLCIFTPLGATVYNSTAHHGTCSVQLSGDAIFNVHVLKMKLTQ